MPFEQVDNISARNSADSAWRRVNLTCPKTLAMPTLAALKPIFF
jgi:hypothetical protein